MKKELIYELITGLLVLLFLYTGLSKLLDFKAFELSMRFQHLPDWITTPAIYTLPTTEIIVAGLLITEKSRMIGLYAFIALMFIFTLYAGAVLINLFPIAPCPCGGAIKSLGWPQHFLLNLAFLGLALANLFFYNRQANPSTRKSL